MNITLYIWRQNKKDSDGKFIKYPMEDINPHMSFLEMLDVLNERLIKNGEEAIAFDHDCREGICGACGMVIDGQPHGKVEHTTTCQLHMRNYKDGDVIYVEPYRAKIFPILKDLVVDRTAMDRIIQAGGYISVNTGAVPEANTTPISKKDSSYAMDAAECIGCGACVAACPNGAAMLFTGSKISHLASLPQGKVERSNRIKAMVEQMDKEGFGACSNHYECEAVCPKGLSVSFISKMNRELLVSIFNK
ncbi:MAG: succinate dehydrogenase [Bacteroidetes bacterium 4572_77]|nr:MAG: succinate dehydrogenase [Bacteroidetes bacterium 4572_77]